jgi:hypothetical protein
MTSRSHLGFGLLLGLVGACRPGVGDQCVCEGDCRRGLVCAVGGRLLGAGECVLATASTPLGECVEAADVPDDPDDLPSPPLYFDLGTRRDFDSGQPPETSGTTDTDTDTGTVETGTSTTGTGTTGTTDTGTTGATGTGTTSDSGSETAATQTGTTGGN